CASRFACSLASRCCAAISRAAACSFAAFLACLAASFACCLSRCAASFACFFVSFMAIVGGVTAGGVAAGAGGGGVGAAGVGVGIGVCVAGLDPPDGLPREAESCCEGGTVVAP